MNEKELQAYIEDIWKRAGVARNPAAALYRHWEQRLREGQYLGRPEGPEHPMTLATGAEIIIQEFGSAILWASTQDYLVYEGVPLQQRPVVITEDVPGNFVGPLVDPIGFVIHATRSGQATYTQIEEYEGTLAFVRGGAVDSEGTRLGWHATIGRGRYARHMSLDHFGWNCRAASRHYVALELAQAVEGGYIDQSTWDAVAAYILDEAPDIPRVFICHSELSEGIADGKTDVYPRAQGDDARRAINAALVRASR